MKILTTSPDQSACACSCTAQASHLNHKVSVTLLGSLTAGFPYHLISLPLPLIHTGLAIPRILFPGTGRFTSPMTPFLYHPIKSQIPQSLLLLCSSHLHEFLAVLPHRSFEIIILKSDQLVRTESCNYYNHIQKFIWQYRLNHT